MFAAQGILAALYRRDALGGGRGQVVDVSLMEACFALLESTVPEYDRLGIVRGPGGTGLKGVAPSNIFKSSDDKWMVIAANADNVFGRLCEAMGRPELADDPRFATHLARGENQEELEGIVAEWAGAARPRPRSTAMLNEAGVICGPIYTIADIFEDEQFRAREMLLEHDDPEFGAYIGPGHRPEVLARRPARCAGRRPGRRAATTARSTAGCSASPTTSSRELEGGGRPVTRHDLRRRRRATGSRTSRRSSTRETRAELVNRLAAAGLPRIEAVSFVNPARVPADGGRRGGRRRRSSARDGVVYAGLVLNERGYDRLRGDRRSTRCTSPSPRPRRSTSATRTPRRRSRSRPRARSSSAPTRTASARR